MSFSCLCDEIGSCNSFIGVGGTDIDIAANLARADEDFILPLALVVEVGV
jgi:hypothetical protein